MHSYNVAERSMKNLFRVDGGVADSLAHIGVVTHDGLADVSL